MTTEKQAGTALPEAGVNTRQRTGHDGQTGDQHRLPHERDESPDQRKDPRSVGKQAASDVEQGLADTSRAGPGVEATSGKPTGSAPAQPQPGSKRD